MISILSNVNYFTNLLLLVSIKYEWNYWVTNKTTNRMGVEKILTTVSEKKT